MAGIPDITTLNDEYHYRQRYKESILEGSEEQVLEKVKSEINKASEDIREASGSPIFCTITNMNIAKYNHFLLRKHRTYTLQNTHNYDTMQTYLENIISKINEHIVAHNKINQQCYTSLPLSNPQTPWEVGGGVLRH